MAKSAKFFKRESLFKPKHVVHQVGDNELKFYPVSLTMLWRLRTFFEPVIEALRVLTGGKNDVERTVDQGVDEEGNKRTITHMGAIAPDVARLREERSDQAWSKALDCIFGDECRKLLGELFADSLRDEFTREEAHDADVGDEVMKSLDLATTVAMVNGLLKANTRVFGPFAEKVRKAAEAKLDDALGDVAGVAPEGSRTQDSTDEALDLDGELVEQPSNDTETPSPAS